MMDGRHLDEIAAFLAVTESGSFTLAARKLERDASVLSRRVSALEARLAIRLLERSTRRVVPTEAGLRLFDRMRDVASAMSEAEQEASAAGERPQGTLKLALPTAFGRMWIAPILPAFLQAYPGIGVEARYQDRYVDLVAEGFDVAIRIGDLADSRLVTRRLCTNTRLLCASPGYVSARGAPDSPEDLKTHACLGFTGLVSHPDWRFRRGDRHAAVRVRGPLVCDDAESLIKAALAGAGIMMVSDWLAGPELAQGRLRPVLPDWTVEGEGAIHVIRPSAQFTPAKTRVFVDWVVARLTPPPWRPAPAASAPMAAQASPAEDEGQG